MNAEELNAVIKRVIKRHGPVIDLRKNPETLIEIVRNLAPEIAGENPCGGTPPPLPSPTPPPGPSKAGGPVTNDDILRAVLKVSREIAAIRKVIVVPSQPR